MAKLPTEEELGGLPQARIPAGLPSASLPRISGGEAIGAGVAKFGAGIAKLGLTLRAQTNEVELARAKAEYLLKAGEIEANPDAYSPDAYRQAGKAAVDRISDPELKEKFGLYLAPKMLGDARNLWKTQEIQGLDARVQKLHNDIVTHPEIADERLIEINHEIEVARRNGLMTRAQARAYAKGAVGNVATDLLKDRFARDPEGALQEFNDWQTSRPTSPSVSGESAGSLADVPMTKEERNFLGLTLKYESGGENIMNYVGRAQGISPTKAKGYTAQGYYQILNSNWARLAPGLGITEPNAMAASFKDQTRVALALLRESGRKNWVNFNPKLKAAVQRGEVASGIGVGDKVSTMTDVSSQSGQDQITSGQLGDVPGSIVLDGGTTRPKGPRDALFQILSEYNPGALVALKRAGEEATLKRRVAFQAELAEQTERMILDAAAGRGELPSVEYLDSLGLSTKTLNDLLKKRDTAAKEVEKYQGVVQMFNAGVPLNRFNKDHMNGLDKIYTARGGRPALKSTTEIARAVAPLAVKDLRNDMLSNDPTKLVRSASAINDLLQMSPTILNGVDGAQEMIAFATEYKTLTYGRGLSSEDAIKEIINNRLPETKALKAEQAKLLDLDTIVTENVKDTDLGEHFGSDRVGRNQTERTRLYRAYRQSFEHWYRLNPDVEDAKEKALNEIKRTMGVSSLSGPPSVVFYPPELSPGWGGIKDAAKYIKREALEVIKERTGEDVDPSRVFLSAHPRSTPDAYLRGKPTPYVLQWQSKDGEWHVAPDAFYPDSTLGATRQDAERESLHRRNQEVELLKREIGDDPRLPFGVPGPGMPMPRSPMPEPLSEGSQLPTPTEGVTGGVF